MLRSYYQLKLLVGATLEGLAEKDLQRQCHTEGTNMVVGLLLSIQTIDFWRAGHSLSVPQPNGSPQALAPGPGGAGVGLSALGGTSSKWNRWQSLPLHPGSHGSSAPTPTLPPKPGWGELLAWRFPKKIERKVAGSGWVSQGVSPGDMVGTTLS